MLQKENLDTMEVGELVGDIVLSSITKKGEIVTNMAPFMPFRVILVIE